MPVKKITFPKDFLWGAATAAHQIEGNNTNSDWWKWETSVQREAELKARGKNPLDYQSGIACDSYNRYEEDFALAKELSQNATRLSIEWARIEPREGYFAEREFEHYEKVLRAAKANGLTTFVTLHHFTSPIWFADHGGFSKEDNIYFFTRYAKLAAKRLFEYVDFFITFNEPEIYSTHGFLLGVHPPFEKSFLKTYQVTKNIINAHNLVGREIHFLTGKPVGMAYHLSDFKASSIFSEPLKYLAHYFSNEFILNRTLNYCDFVGVNYYNHKHLGLLGLRSKSHSNHETSDMGWGIHPEGLERVLLSLKKYKKPVYITENGIADAKDKKRENFIKEHLYFANKALKAGVDLRGYFYWSLLDNFEWTHGFWPRFGLVEIDREDLLRRKVRHSALKYAEICKNNGFEYLI